MQRWGKNADAIPICKHFVMASGSIESEYKMCGWEVFWTTCCFSSWD